MFLKSLTNALSRPTCRNVGNLFAGKMGASVGNLSRSLTYNKATLQEFLKLPQPNDRVLITYVWIDGTGLTMRAKDMIVKKEPTRPEDCPKWAFDGSSTGQAEGHNSDVFLHPVALYKDPFRVNANKIVLCETYNSDGDPTATNARKKCAEVMKKVEAHKPWFGIEQEYTLFGKDRRLLGWPTDGVLPPQGPYYCGVGPNKVFGRDVLEAHLRACLYAGLDIGGTNIEVMPSQFEFQIGPTEGVKAADDLWMARFLLERVAEEFGVEVSFDPKPLPEWNGAGAHCNFSTKEMRENGGIKHILDAIEKLKEKHVETMKLYDIHGGEDNKRRLTGLHETSSINTFTYGVADRGASVRITAKVHKEGKGFLEDRRPAANADMYKVTQNLCAVTLL